MKLWDTTEVLDPIREEYPPHGSLFREHRKLKEAVSGEDKIKRLVRIQTIVKTDPSTIPAAMELIFKFQVQDGDREVVLQVREVLLDCLIPMVERTSTMDPELCTRAMEILARIDFPNDRNFLHEMDKILLEKFPYSYTVHHHIQQRQNEATAEPLRGFEADLVGVKTLASLRELGQSSGTNLLYGTTIDVDACKAHDDLPPDLLRFAACQELSGNFLDALNIFQAMRATMRSRPLFSEYAPFLVHFRNLIYRSSLAPQIITNDKQLEACTKLIMEVDGELSFITGGWAPAFSGTAKIQKMMKAVEGSDYAGAPLYGQRELRELVATLNVRMKQELLN